MRPDDLAFIASLAGGALLLFVGMLAVFITLVMLTEFVFALLSMLFDVFVVLPAKAAWYVYKWYRGRL